MDNKNNLFVETLLSKLSEKMRGNATFGNGDVSNR